MITIHTEALNQGLSVHTRSLSLHSEPEIEKFHARIFDKVRGKFCMGAMGASAPAILKNRLLAPAIFGHFSTGGKNFGC